MSTIKIQDKIIVNGKSYNIHPIYNLYASSEDGYIIHIVKQNPMIGNKQRNGYLLVEKKKLKGYYTHRFIWECYNGVIQDDKVIDHINNIIDDNRLCNLQLLTQ